jgi:hypothetical protein
MCQSLPKLGCTSHLPSPTGVPRYMRDSCTSGFHKSCLQMLYPTRPPARPCTTSMLTLQESTQPQASNSDGTLTMTLSSGHVALSVTHGAMPFFKTMRGMRVRGFTKKDVGACRQCMFAEDCKYVFDADCWYVLTNPVRLVGEHRTQNARVKHLSEQGFLSTTRSMQASGSMVCYASTRPHVKHNNS